MALPSRLGAFMVGAALGSAQCFYWLHLDVKNVSMAMTRKIESVKLELEEKERLAGLKLSAIESAAAGSGATSQAVHTASAQSPA